MGDLTATVFIRAGTDYHVFDDPGSDGNRVVGLTFSGLTIQVAGGWDRGRDAEIVAATGSLIDHLEQLRTLAAARVAAQARADLPDGVLFFGTVGQFLDGLTDQAPGELMEAWGK